MSHTMFDDTSALRAAVILRRGLRQKLKEQGKTFADVFDIQFFDDPSLMKVRRYGIYGWVQFDERTFAMAVDWRIGMGFKPSDVFDYLDRWIAKQKWAENPVNKMFTDHTEGFDVEEDNE